MKRKLFFAAMALPLMFASCSQEDIISGEFDSNVPSNAIKGLKLGLEKNAVVDGLETRANWNDDETKLTFETNDKISVYWLGDASTTSGDVTTFTYQNLPAKAENLTGKFNTVFNTPDAGNTFSTQAMVFEGGNIAVFPANTSFVNEGALEVKVAKNQDATVQDNIPYISNQLYIKKHGNYQSEQLPGYYGDGDVIYAPMKQVANVVNLTLNLTNIPENKNFTVQSVELVSPNNLFATTAAVQRLAVAATTKKEVAYNASNKNAKMATLIAQAWINPTVAETTLKTTALEQVGSKVVARFVVLPTDQTVSGNAYIRVNTNCGYIDLKHENSILEEGAVKVMGGSNNPNGRSINEAFAQFVDVYTDTREEATFSNENMGKVMDRSIAVDVNKAVLTGSEVYTSADIIRYVELYQSMEKAGTADNNLNLVLTSASANEKFPALTKEAVEKFEALKTLDKTAVFTLTAKDDTKANGGVQQVEVTGGGNVFDIKSLTSAVKVVLDNSAEWTMNDTFTFTTAAITLQNNGTLTINGTMNQAGTAHNVIAETIANNGTIKIGGDNTLKVNGALSTTATSTINVEAGQTLNFTANITSGLRGTINVKDITSFLTVAEGVNVTNNGTINNWGTIASVEYSNVAGWVNAAIDHDGDATTAKVGGVIKVQSDDAITYVYDNTDGTIEMSNRTNEIKVSKDKEGKIAYDYTSADGATFKYTAADRFTYVKFADDVTSLTLMGADKTAGTLAPENISMEFTGVTTLKSNNITIDVLYVAANANLRVLSGNTLNVSDLVNNGTITIGGTIKLPTGVNASKKGNVLSMGGAIQ